MLPLGLATYRAATLVFGPLAPWLLAWRAARGKEDPARLGERLGRPSRARPEGPLAWLHAASVGESLMLLALVERLGAERPDLGMLITTGTTTSAELMARRLPAHAIHQYLPVDRPLAARGFLAHWRPALAVFAESELWPNLLLEAKDRGARLALINARVTEDSLKGWRRAPASARRLLGLFDLIGAADRRSVEGLSALLGRDVAFHGNLKFAAAAPAAEEAELARLRAAIGDRPVWLAASTHEGEDAIALEAHAQLRADAAPKPLLVIAPRHPARGPVVAALAEARGLGARRRGAGETLEAATDVYVADTMGEMGLWFRLADATLMGGSLAPGVGGHNPIEPALLESPIIAGPHVFNFESLYEELWESGGAGRVRNADELAREIRLLDGALRLTRVQSAHSIASRGANVLETVLGELRPLLPKREHG